MNIAMLRVIIVFTFLVVTSLAPAQCVWNNTTFVHRSNEKIVDGQNNTIRLDGLNLGGWLSWVGWIWGGGFTSETDIVNNMKNGVGVNATNAFRDSVYNNFITRSDIEKIAHQCNTVVRIPFNHLLLEDDAVPYVYKAQGWAILDSVLKWCEDNNIYAVLDLHAAPGGQSSSFTADPDFLINLWNGSINQDRTKRLWKAIATRYRNKGIIAGYDLLNEPNTSSNADLTNLYHDIIDSIRSVDTHHLIFLEGNNYAQDFGFFTSIPDTNCCFEFHIYTWFGFNPAQVFNSYKSISTTLNVPFWCGEYGENDIPHLDSTLIVLNDTTYHFSGNAFWTYKKAKQAFQYPYYFGINDSPEWQKSITWIGNTSSPSPTSTEMQTGINSFIENIKVNNCIFNDSLNNILQHCNITGIHSISDYDSLVLYPNPFNGSIIVSTSEKINFYQLANSAGQLIKSGSKIATNEFSELKDGIYFLKVEGVGINKTVKIVKY